MATADLVSKATEPAFYTRVLFLSMIVAQDVASEDPQTANHINRMKYANMIFRGEENAPLLAAHIIAANGTIQNTIIAGNEPSDGDVQFVLASIWNARANAFAE